MCRQHTAVGVLTFLVLPAYLRLPGGTYREGDISRREPDQIDDNYPLDCAGANATQAYGSPKAWGWADSKCDEPRIFMCKKASEYLGFEWEQLLQEPGSVQRSL